MNRLGWGDSALILFWAAFFGAVFGFGLFVAFGQVNPVQLETNGDHRFPDTTSWVGYSCESFDPNSSGFVAVSVAGTQTQCQDCVEGSDPAACSTDPNSPGTGCMVEYQNGRWFCVGRALGTVPCCPCDLACQNGGFCVIGVNGPECVCPCPFTGTLCDQTRTTVTTTTIPGPG